MSDNPYQHGVQAAGGLAVEVDLKSGNLSAEGDLTLLGMNQMTLPCPLEDLSSRAAPLDQAIFKRLLKAEALDARIRLFADDHSIHFIRLIGRPDGETWRGLLLPAGPVQSGQRDRQSQERALKDGLDRGEITPFYQPVIQLDNHQLAGFEALARWDQPGSGIVEPDQFLALSRELDLETRIGELILDGVLQDTRSWEDAGLLPPDCFVAINATPEDLGTAHWVKAFIAQFEASGLSRGRLRIEINENDVMQDGPELMDHLKAIRQAGIALVMDDFGTGYSSLARLDQLPFSVLKIDQYFIRSMINDDASRAIVRSVCGLARHYGMSVVAEGIESEALAASALEAGCNYGQGFWYSAALSSQEVSQVLKDCDHDRIIIAR